MKRGVLPKGLAVAAAAVLAGVTVQAAVPAAQAATTLSVVAVSQVQNLINTVRGQTGTYTGVWINTATNTVYVSAPSASVTASAVAAGVAARAEVGRAKIPANAPVATKASTMKIVVVHATYSFAQLQAIQGRVTRDAGLRKTATASHATLSEWYPDPETDKVVIGFTKVTPAETAAVKAEYGSTARVITAPVFTSYVLKLSRNAVHPDYSRTDDGEPWYGGDRLYFDDGDGCTSGYEWSNGTMTTAGHCGGDPTSFYNNSGETSSFYEGKTYTVQYGNNRIDMQEISGSLYGPYVWAGSNGSTAEPVSGSGGVANGGLYCTDGSYTGVNCTAQVEAIDGCFDVGNVNECDLDEAYSTNFGSLATYGDSGGPVFTHASPDAPYAVGTIVGGASNGQIALWSDMYMEKEIFGGAPAVG